MLVEAFSPPNFANGLTRTPLPSFLPIHESTALLASTTTSQPMPSTASIEYDEELQQYTVTIAPFLPFNEQDEDTTYPSLLHQIHILPLLTDEETSTLLQLARDYATENQSWDQQDSSRHVSYQTVDFAIEESVEISQYLGASGIGFEERIFSALSDAYDVDAEDMSFLDLFCASYEVKENPNDNNIASSL